MKQGFENESSGKKCCIAIGSIVHLGFAASVGIVYALWWANVAHIQSGEKTACDNSLTDDCTTDVNTYDVTPLLYY